VAFSRGGGKTRVAPEDGSVLFTIPGGVDDDSALRQPNPFVPRVGKDKRGDSWSDLQVVAALVGYFIFHDVLVLLSADTHENKGGLRSILKQR
jgi:hypothetical protein